MPRPDFVTKIDITRWDAAIDSDKEVPKEYYSSAVIREVCYAGSWLYEELVRSNCPESLAFRVQYTAGMMSYGRDPWEVATMLVGSYKKGELVFEPDPEALPQLFFNS